MDRDCHSSLGDSDSSMKVLIVDDEPLARRGVRVCLAAEEDVEIVGECASGSEALRYIREVRPDLVFLDVQMPGMNGFEVVARIGPEVNPLIIFSRPTMNSLCRHSPSTPSTTY
jgi:two-component system LytT family response regulator